MNTQEIVERLPERLQQWLSGSPHLRVALEQGQALEDILRDGSHAEFWVRRASLLVKETLAFILRTFASLPFEEGRLLTLSASEGQWTGAETRLALQQLRRDGILFAVRSSRGERLLLLPCDMFEIWQRLLTPLLVMPLAADRQTEIEAEQTPYRLPLSQELVHAWSAIRRLGLPLTAQGQPHKRLAMRIADTMQLDAQVPISPGQYGTQPDGDLPARLAFILELGMLLGMLQREEKRVVAVPDTVALAWLNLSVQAAECRLLDLIVFRYAAQEAGLHFCAGALRMLKPGDWYATQALIEAMPTAAACEAMAGWLHFMTSLGWAEKGSLEGESVWRWTMDPHHSVKSIEGLPEQSAVLERFEVLPDLEIIVPPEVRPVVRWKLEEMADRIASDVVSTYRLSASACARAIGLGYTGNRLIAELEQGAGVPLPGPVVSVLLDWFRGIEHQLGRSIMGETEMGLVLEKGRKTASMIAMSPLFYPSPQPQSLYQVEEEPPAGSRALFPGWRDIPAAWLQQPRAYHISTRRELVERAVGWRTALYMRWEASWITFLPEQMVQHAEGWTVHGRVRRQQQAAQQEGGDSPLDERLHDEDRVDFETSSKLQRASFGGEEIAELMIVLPDPGPASQPVD